MTPLFKQYENFNEVVGENHAFDCTIRNEDFFIFFMRKPESVNKQEDDESYDEEIVKTVIGYFRTR